MRGSEFANRHERSSTSEREAAILDLALRCSGFVRWPTRPVRLATPHSTPHSDHVAVLQVACDYFAIGEEGDFVRMPLTPGLAKKIGEHFGWRLPTKKIVDAVWRQADIKLPPRTMLPDVSMVTMPVFDAHNVLVQAVLDKNYPGQRGQLVAGHKKDVVVSPRLRPGRVGIYGWHQVNGVPIQGLNLESHDDQYVDYSHGVRYIDARIEVNGVDMDLDDVFADPDLWVLVSDEGPFMGAPDTIPGPPATPKEEQPVLRKGMKGSHVADWQSFLDSAGFRGPNETTLAVDGDFGAATEHATREFQASVGVAPDGVVGAVTLQKAAAYKR